MIDMDGCRCRPTASNPVANTTGTTGSACNHALIASCAESGDLIDGTLRPGAVGSADGALPFIQTVVERCRQRVCKSVLVRIDAGFPGGQTLEGLEAEGIDYVARIRNNAVLDRMAQPYLRRPPGRPPREGRVWCHELRHQADTWEHARQVVVVERPGELFVDHFWLPTTCAATATAAHAGQGGGAHGRVAERAGAGAVVGAAPEEPLPRPPSGGRHPAAGSRSAGAE